MLSDEPPDMGMQDLMITLCPRYCVALIPGGPNCDGRLMIGEAAYRYRYTLYIGNGAIVVSTNELEAAL